MLQTHASPFAGRWYPAETTQLRDLIESNLAESVRRVPFQRNRGLAFVVPHAAPQYSGVVAASVYRHLAALNPDRIVLLGFSHRRSISGIGVPDLDVMSTPLGAVDLDTATMQSLSDAAPFHRVSEAVVCDHSIEIQLPFVQTVAPQARLIPLYIGCLTADERAKAGDRLRHLVDEGTVLIASSDFTHYGPDFGYMPFQLDDSTPERLRRLDRDLMEAATSLDADQFSKELRETRSTLCGSDPIGLLLEIVRGLGGEEIYQETLDYQTSGEITSDYSHCVSYAALGYFRRTAFDVSAQAQRELLDLANAALANQPPPPVYSPELDQHRNVFVTLYQHGELRGCVGSCRDPEPLKTAVPELALSALDDRRFDPVDSGARIDIEISVLTPFKRIHDRAELIAGEHGGFLEARGRAGLLLPKVASERGWGTQEFLDALAMKARLPAGIYRDPEARLFAFRAQVFSNGAATQ